MSIDETLSHGVQREDDDKALTTGIVSFAIGLTSVMGGGVISNAFQIWSFDIARQGNAASGSIVQAMGAVPPIVLGTIAIVLGLVAGRSGHALTSATAKAGATMGLLAIVGGALWAVAMLRSDFY